MPGPLDREELRLRQLLAIAADMDGRQRAERSAFAKELAGVDLADGAYDHVINPLRGRGKAVRPTLDVDHTYFSLRPYVLRVAGRSLEQPDLFAALDDLPGVCAIVELDDELDLLVFC